jgi:hypothetical protein
VTAFDKQKILMSGDGQLIAVTPVEQVGEGEFASPEIGGLHAVFDPAFIFKGDVFKV